MADYDQIASYKDIYAAHSVGPNTSQCPTKSAIVNLGLKVQGSYQNNQLVRLHDILSGKTRFYYFLRFNKVPSVGTEDFNLTAFRQALNGNSNDIYALHYSNNTVTKVGSGGLITKSVATTYSDYYIAIKSTTAGHYGISGAYCYDSIMSEMGNELSCEYIGGYTYFYEATFSDWWYYACQPDYENDEEVNIDIDYPFDFWVV